MSVISPAEVLSRKLRGNQAVSMFLVSVKSQQSVMMLTLGVATLHLLLRHLSPVASQQRSCTLPEVRLSI